MVECSNCNTVVNKSDIFCSNCGLNLLTNTVVSQAREVIDKPMDLDLNTITRFQHLEARIESLQGISHELLQQRTYLNNLKNSLTTAQERLRTLAYQRKKEHRDVEKLEKMSVTSFVARVKGKKEQQLEKEKMEYFDALNKEEAAAKECQKLTTLISQTQDQVNQLEDLVREKRKLEKDLKELIHEVCEGVADPVEDEIERRLAKLENEIGPITNQRSRIFRAKNHLEHAIDDLNFALDALNSASGYSTWDTFFGGGMFVDSIKHSRMSEARNRVHNAQYSLQQARHEYPDMPYLGGGAHVEELSFFWDGFMDNIFSDFSSRGKIHRSRESVRQALHDASNALNWLGTKLNNVNQQFTDLNQKIDETKKNLFEERKRMILDAIGKH